MPDWILSPVVLLSALVLGIVLVRAGLIVRREARLGINKIRGSKPGTGINIIYSEYQSGAGGGGSQGQTRIPQDPQAYARAFVPRAAKSKE